MKNLKIKSKAFITSKVNNKFILKFKNYNINLLKKNEVLIKLKYSSINYKDILVCNGLFWGCRNYPLIPGIDGSGMIVESNSKKFKKNDKVVIVASDAGSKTEGCFSNYIRIKDTWVNKLPKNLSIRDSMIFGTAGFTAMSIIRKITKTKKKKSILITGASGGVGLFSTYILSKLGHSVTVVTRKNKKFLFEIGAKKVVLFKDLKDKVNLPLQKTTFDACIDNIGGDALDFMLKRIKNNGTLYSVGFANNKSTSNINLMPFILRRVKIIGIHTESLKLNERLKIWELISVFIKKFRINKNLFKKIKFKNLAHYIKNFNILEKKGRFLVLINK